MKAWSIAIVSLNHAFWDNMQWQRQENVTLPMAWSSFANMSREAFIATQTRLNSTSSLREEEEEPADEEEPKE